MDSLRRRINLHRTGHRVKKLWAEYKQAVANCSSGDAGRVEGEGEPESRFHALAGFIDSVYAGEGAAGLISEGLNSEWVEMMTVLLDVAGRRYVLVVGRRVSVHGQT